MCGIAGVVYDEPRDVKSVESVISAMCAAQSQRGPDGQYFWTNGRVGFGMVRLAIVGSASRGQQPIQSASGARLIFNGELYEPETVMASLGGDFGEEECDGVVLLRLLEERGLDGLCGISAMFGLALHQPTDESVLLARDAWGQKPLYKTRIKGGWAFASTIAALHAAAGPLRIRSDAMRECLIFKSVGGFGASFEGVEQVLPGGWLRISRDGSITEGRWYSPPDPQEVLADERYLHDVLISSIRRRVPTRFRSSLFLSGGFDSSLVAAVAANSPEGCRPHVLTVGYDVGGWQDEHALALRLADELGLKHETLMLQAEQVPELLSDTAVALEDPNHDPVVVPTLLLARAASEETKVVLTGDGSDEFWGGYARFDNPPTSLDAYLKRTMVFYPTEVGMPGIPASYLSGIEIPPEGSMAPLDRIMRLEVANRLRNYHLARIDKLSMSVALEVRSPFLDLAVTSYAESLTAEAKRPNDRPKGLLIDAFRGQLPQWLLERRKQAFTVPIEEWLAGPLLGLVQDMLAPATAFVREFTDPTPLIAGIGQTPLDLPRAMRIWSLLHLEIWRQEFARRMELAP